MNEVFKEDDLILNLFKSENLSFTRTSKWTNDLNNYAVTIKYNSEFNLKIKKIYEYFNSKYDFVKN